jgi:hypothetical protein
LLHTSKMITCSSRTVSAADGNCSASFKAITVCIYMSNLQRKLRGPLELILLKLPQSTRARERDTCRQKIDRTAPDASYSRHWELSWKPSSGFQGSVSSRPYIDARKKHMRSKRSWRHLYVTISPALS